MQYLSEKIKINYSPAAGTTYLTYTVSRIPILGGSWEVIYTGRAYRTAATQTLYLNDIIENYSLDTSFFGPGEDGIKPSALSHAPGYIYKYRVSFSDGTSYQTDWVLSYHKDINLPDGPNKDFYFEEQGHHGFDILQERTHLLPRIPDLPTITEKFWFMPSVIVNDQLYDDSAVDGDRVFVVSNGSVNKTYDSYGGMWHTNVWNMSNSNNLYDLTHGGTELFVQSYVEEGTPWSVKVANIDSCPADYYVIWMDRTGAYQCQPFTRRVDYSESITTLDVVNAQEETRPYLKQVSSSWTLNSDWMKKDDRKAFESLLVSPYIYLYDTKQDLGWWVKCTDSSWQDKVYKNEKKMFNFSVTLKSVASQNIVY